MRLPRDVSGRELASRLQAVGYETVGSHMRLSTQDDAHSITIPDHDSLRLGTLSAVLLAVASHLGIGKDELIRLLFGD